MTFITYNNAMRQFLGLPKCTDRFDFDSLFSDHHSLLRSTAKNGDVSIIIYYLEWVPNAYKLVSLSPMPIKAFALKIAAMYEHSAVIYAYLMTSRAQSLALDNVCRALEHAKFAHTQYALIDALNLYITNSAHSYQALVNVCTALANNQFAALTAIKNHGNLNRVMMLSEEGLRQFSELLSLRSQLERSAQVHPHIYEVLSNCSQTPLHAAVMNCFSCSLTDGSLTVSVPQILEACTRSSQISYSR
jgi:hypothetical protein